MTCKHHWIVTQIEGERNREVCKYCGKVQVVSNVPPDLITTKNGFRRNKLNLRESTKIPFF